MEYQRHTSVTLKPHQLELTNHLYNAELHLHQIIKIKFVVHDRSVSKSLYLSVRLKIPQNTSFSSGFIEVLVQMRGKLKTGVGQFKSSILDFSQQLMSLKIGVCMGFDNVIGVPYICIELFNIKTVMQSHCCVLCGIGGGEAQCFLMI